MTNGFQRRVEAMVVWWKSCGKVALRWYLAYERRKDEIFQVRGLAVDRSIRTPTSKVY